MSTVVPVIASFDIGGHIVPLYVRINQKAYKLQVVYCKPIEPENGNYNIYKYHYTFEIIIFPLAL